MQATLVVCWLFLSCSYVVLSRRIDWLELKNKLNVGGGESTAIVIAKNWDKRPPNFFQGLREESWRKISQRLSPSQSKEIQHKEFESMTPEVLRNILHRNKACPTIDISFWTEERIKHISTECLHRILVKNKAPVTLGKLWENILWPVVYNFTKGMKLSLRKIDLGDFYFMKPNVLEEISQVSEICSALGIEFWNEKTITGISAECLHTILKESKEPVKLGKLWEEIDWSVVHRFTDEMKPSLQKIDPSDFYFMDSGLLRVILPSTPKVCSALGVELWSEETIKSISVGCLHDILKEAQGTVKLGKLWREIGWSAVDNFTEEMKPSLRNIDLSDFYFMDSDLLRAILPFTPKVCSALGVEFWTEETIESITGDCLHELLTKYELPAKLGSMWKGVPLSCCNLLEKNGFSLDSVHPDDWVSAGKWMGKVIKSQPSLCQTLSASFWNEETIKYMTRGCLFDAIHETKRPFALGRLWDHISSPVLREFAGAMLDKLKNVAGSDFQYMPSSVLQSIFSSERPLDYLPHPRSEIILSARASEVSMGPLRFAKLVKSAPSVAGQLLWYSAKLSKDVLSECDGKDIRGLSLAIPGEEMLDWKDLFGKLEKKYSLAGESERFGQIIQHISQNTENHFCATLDLDEYRSLAWLHPNLSESCLSKLRLKPDEVSELFSRPELAANSLSWRKMLRDYSPSDWALLSQSKIINGLLGRNCSFWGAISGGSWSKVFGALDKSIFRSIVPECVLKLTNVLRQNTAILQLLSDDAFAKHRVDQLPCRLNSLSTTHISHLSSKLSMNSDQSGKETAYIKISPEELKDLSFEQFKSLYESRWIGNQRKIKDMALNCQLEKIQSQLLAAAKKLKSNNFRQNFEDLTADQLNGFRTIEDTLTAVIELYKNNRQGIPETGLTSILTAIKESESRETFIQAFVRSSKLRPAILGLVRDADDLKHLILEAFDRIGAEERADLLLLHDGGFGFDRTGIIDILEKMPALFASPNARVKNQTIVDGGGAIRSLASQLLGDIERDLVVPYTRAMDYGGITHKARIGVSAGNCKFVWGISKQVGLAVGLALGKTLQLEIRMPFALNLRFYELLIDTSDKVIESYYKTTYSQEVFKYRQSILGLYNAGNLDALLDIIPKLDSLRFTGLSTKTGAEEAKQDIKTRTNLRGCSDEDCYADIKELEGKEFIENYIEAILEKTKNEFKEFVRELVRGMGMALPPVKGFDNLPVPVLRPFAEFLPGLLNAEPIKGENVLERVEFNGGGQVPSLIQGQTIAASAVFSAFVLSLGTKQLEHLIGIWTGSSTLLLKYSELSVTFMSPGDIPSYQVNFCEAEKGNHLIAPGKEYQEFFSKFSEKLLGAEVTVSPDCGPERPGIVPVRPTTCTKNLMVCLQPAEQMLNSLVDLLHTPLTTLWDNQ